MECSLLLFTLVGYECLSIITSATLKWGKEAIIVEKNADSVFDYIYYTHCQNAELYLAFRNMFMHVDYNP